jgi:hypothetical protein
VRKFKADLTAFYATRDPASIAKVDGLLAGYDVVLLAKAIQKKYGCVPEGWEEHLRPVGPEEDNEEHDLGETWEDVMSAGAGAGRAASKRRQNQHSIGMQLCPGGHSLRKFQTVDVEYVCDKCEVDIPRNLKAYGCRECEYDVCGDCFTGRTQAAAAAAAAATEAFKAAAAAAPRTATEGATAIRLFCSSLAGRELEYVKARTRAALRRRGVRGGHTNREREQAKRRATQWRRSLQGSGLELFAAAVTGDDATSRSQPQEDRRGPAGVSLALAVASMDGSVCHVTVDAAAAVGEVRAAIVAARGCALRDVVLHAPGREQSLEDGERLDDIGVGVGIGIGGGGGGGDGSGGCGGGGGGGSGGGGGGVGGGGGGGGGAQGPTSAAATAVPLAATLFMLPGGFRFDAHCKHRQIAVSELGLVAAISELSLAAAAPAPSPRMVALRPAVTEAEAGGTSASFLVGAQCNGVFVGVVPAEAARHAESGTCHHGPAAAGQFMLLSTGSLFGSGKSDADAQGGFAAGDTVTVRADAAAGGVLFFRNGRRYGPGFASGLLTLPFAFAVQMRVGELTLLPWDSGPAGGAPYAEYEGTTAFGLTSRDVRVRVAASRAAARDSRQFRTSDAREVAVPRGDAMARLRARLAGTRGALVAVATLGPGPRGQ